MSTYTPARRYSPVPDLQPPSMPTARTCVQCGSNKTQRVKNRIGNGGYQVFDLCLACGENARGHAVYLPHSKVGKLDLIPVHKDYAVQNQPCEVCGKREGTELHHFAPRHIFEDAEQWPQAYLCKAHHDEWHIRMAAHFAEGTCHYCNGLAVKELSHANY